MNRNKSFSVLLGFVLMATFAAVSGCKPSTPPPTATPDKKALYWYDPMVPEQKFDKPGKSPFMDMQLVPKYPDEPVAAGEDRIDDGSLRIDPRVVQNLGVRLAKVERAALSREVSAVGVVAVDEHRIEAVQVRAAGWVEQLAVRAAGDPVKRGALLASVYAPELLAAQQEFLLAQKSGDAGLREAAKSRLSLFGLTQAQIDRVAKSGTAERRVAYYAPFDGYVMELGVRQGAAVQPGMMMFQLAATDSVWVNVEVPEAQAAWIKAGDKAMVELPSAPGESRVGKVEYVYPELSAATRTLKLRVQIDNHLGLMRPGMYATVRLAGTPRAEALTVPSEALIRTGTRSIVLVAEDLSRFRPVTVKVGAEVGDRSEILEGLKEGQDVVASGQFLIDSEASLRGALDRLAPAADAPAPEATPTKAAPEPMPMPMPTDEAPAPAIAPSDGGHEHADHGAHAGHTP